MCVPGGTQTERKGDFFMVFETLKKIISEQLEVDPEALEKIKTVGDLVAFVEDRT